MLVELLILGAIIGSNNFATALALGALGQKVRRWRIVLTFGLFEFFIPLLGLWLGQRASGFVAGSVDWLGPALLA
ncbi:MAG TPA: manganese efflux pump, partial [Sphingomicrobium sp.]|nr:manganese efflux pump [Sphingomicrobium sp.]